MTNDQLYLLTEAAELTGVTVDTIRQRIKRRKLYAVKGNDGRVRVKLSEADIAALKAGQPTSQLVDLPTSRLAEDSSVIKALRDHLNATRDDLARERTEHATERERLNREVDRARAEVERIRADVGRLSDELERGRAALADERQHSKAMASLLDMAHREHAAKLDELQKAIDLARRPWWRRLMGR
jgi:septal ring factor EnvC (AmiA/AmiB activator)